MSTGVAAMKMPRQPADDEHGHERQGEQHGRGALACCRGTAVPSQLKTLTADGRAIMMVATMKPVPRRGSMPLWNI